MKQKSTATANTTKKSHRKGLSIKVETVAFWFWFFLGIEGCLTFLFFQSQPAIGTLVSYLPPASLTFLLISSVIIGSRLKHSRIFDSIAAQLIAALAIWSGITLCWSGANPLFSAFGYWVTFTGKLVVILLLLSLANVERVAIKSFQGFAWGSLVYGLAPVLLNSKTIEGRLGNELFLHPNSIGNQMGIACLCTIYLVLQSWGKESERRPYTVILAILLFILLRSMSKTSILSFAVAGGIYIVRSRISFQKKMQLAVASLFLLGIASVVLAPYLDAYLNDQQGGEALTTASGRTAIWEMTWDMIQKNPIWGYGYLSYRDVAPQIIAVRLVHPHNEVLNVWFNLGVVGLVISILIYVFYYLLLERARRAGLPQEALGMALFIYVLIRSLTEANIPDFMMFPSSLMMLLSVWLSQKKQVSLNNGNGNG